MSRSRNEHGLTAQQEAFCRAYLTEADGCASEAYRIAYPTSRDWQSHSVWTHASETLRRPHVRARIAALRAEVDKAAVVSLQEMLQILSGIARTDISGIVGEGGEVDIEQVRRLGASLATYSHTASQASSATKITTHDPVRAIERIARLLGLDAPDKMVVEQVHFDLNLGGGSTTDSESD